MTSHAGASSGDGTRPGHGAPAVRAPHVFTDPVMADRMNVFAQDITTEFVRIQGEVRGTQERLIATEATIQGYAGDAKSLFTQQLSDAESLRLEIRAHRDTLIAEHVERKSEFEGLTAQVQTRLAETAALKAELEEQRVGMGKFQAET
eukprot:8403668-Lingulodinium_polyedra.AAC.1